MTENNEGVPATPEGGGGGNEAAMENVQVLAVKVAELEKASKDKDSDIGSLKRDLKEAKRLLDDAKKALDPESPEKKPQSDEPDYSKIAFLNSIDVKHPDDQKIVMDEAARLKLSLLDVANMPHIKAKLSESLSKRETQDGMPNKSGKTGGSASKDVQYYLDNPDEVPTDSDLHDKVIDARMKKVENTNKWGSTKFIG